MSPFVVVSVLLQVALLTFSEFAMPRAQPEKIQRRIIFFSGLIALMFTGLNIPLYHLVLFVSPLVVLAVLLGLGLFSPLAGWIEGKRDPGDDEKRSVFARDRFLPHLATNAFGAIAASAFIWLGHMTPGFDEFTVAFKNEAAFNIVLPMTTIVILAFVRWQQLDACQNLDALVAADDPTWNDEIRGFSLKHVHQLTNTIYLVLVTFMGAGMILYLFAFTLEQAKGGHPLPLSWQFVVAIVALLAFLVICGLPGQRKHQAVYLTFLTGTPAVLMVALVWLALLEKSTARNIFALSIIVLGYVLYCTLAVLGSPRKEGDKVQLHYFSAAAFAVALTMLTGALYFS